MIKTQKEIEERLKKYIDMLEEDYKDLCYEEIISLEGRISELKWVLNQT